jgi:hypothetical protein
MTAATPIPGYTFGHSTVPAAPITLDELELVRRTLLLGDDDVAALRESEAILADQTDAILDVWYGFVGSHPHLLASFADASGTPDTDYLAAVRRRFGQWILDTARARFDRPWLDYQFEIGRRHHRSGKNRTDGARAADHIAWRYLVALAVPVTATLEPFLGNKGAPPDAVRRMQQAWTKAVLLQAILWSHPYVRDGDF